MFYRDRRVLFEVEPESETVVCSLVEAEKGRVLVALAGDR